MQCIHCTDVNKYSRMHSASCTHEEEKSADASCMCLVISNVRQRLLQVSRLYTAMRFTFIILAIAFFFFSVFFCCFSSHKNARLNLFIANLLFIYMLIRLIHSIATSIQNCRKNVIAFTRFVLRWCVTPNTGYFNRTFMRNNEWICSEHTPFVPFARLMMFIIQHGIHSTGARKFWIETDSPCAHQSSQVIVKTTSQISRPSANFQHTHKHKHTHTGKTEQ